MYKKARIPLVCTYDSEADAAYVYLEHPIASAAVKQVIPFDPADGMFNLDVNAEGHILGLEILGARKRLPPALLQAILESNQDQVHPLEDRFRHPLVWGLSRNWQKRG